MRKIKKDMARNNIKNISATKLISLLRISWYT